MPPEFDHSVQFHLDSEDPHPRLLSWLEEGVSRGEQVLVLARPRRMQTLAAGLAAAGIGRESRSSVRMLDAEEILGRLLVDDGLDVDRAADELERLLREPARAGAGLRIYGEVVDHLATAGRVPDALRLEDAWNLVRQRVPFRLRCGYALKTFGEAAAGLTFDAVCARHRSVAVGAAPASGARLPGIGAALSHAATAAEIVLVVKTEMRRALGAEQAVLGRMLPDGSALEIAGLTEPVDGSWTPGRMVPLDAPLPLVDACRRQRPLYFESPEEIAHAYPSLAAAAESMQALAVAPLRLRGASFGAAAFWYRRPKSFSPAEREQFENAAHQVSLALERAFLYEEAKAAREHLDRVVDSATDAIVILDADDRITRLNPAAERMFGLSAAEAAGRPATVLLPDGLPESSIAEGTLEGVHADGSRFPLEATVSRFDSAGRPCATLVLRDVTERRRAEEALREANRRKDEFLALLGHELRNPLAPILTALELMKLRGVGGEKERQIIERQVLHVSRLVEDLLDVSRITAGKIALKRTVEPLENLVGRAVEMASPLFEQRRHHLTLAPADPPVEVEVDATRIAQAISNLLTNAAKYTEVGGRIDVAWGVREGRAFVEVSDTGIGLRPEQIPAIFDAFAQGRRTLARAQGGLGLGLTLVKSLVELHGGAVHAESEGPNRGSTFAITLPLAPAVAAARPPIGEAAEAADPVASQGLSRRVLVVDDNEDAAESMAEMLRAGGHQVFVAFDAPKALELASRHPIDVGILDIGLPVVDGCELARRLREAVPGIRCLAVTGYGTEADRRRTSEAGFAAHFTKPLRYRDLLAALRDR